MMNNKEDVLIDFFKKANRWRFEIKCGKYRLAGNSDSLSDAEELAFRALTAVPNQGMIHVTYEGGKPVTPRKDRA